MTGRRRIGSLATAALLIPCLASPGAALAHTPVASAVAEYAKNSSLTYYYAVTGYPS